METVCRDAGFKVIAWRDTPTDNSDLGKTALQSEPAVKLSDERVKTSLALVHSRFGTNTLGAWHLAHPYRVTVHNGEINTLRGNLNRMRTREAVLACERFDADIEKIKPVTSEGLSDTAALDNVLELLLESGRSLPHALRTMVPEAWNKERLMEAKRRAFYDFHSTIMEPWDGPALIAATDGGSVAAVLDRNGLRPCRYCVTKENILIMASETGVLETTPSEILLQGRLKPGELFLADTVQKRIVPEQEIFDELTDRLHSRRANPKRRPFNDALPATGAFGIR